MTVLDFSPRIRLRFLLKRLVNHARILGVEIQLKHESRSLILQTTLLLRSCRRYIYIYATLLKTEPLYTPY